MATASVGGRLAVWTAVVFWPFFPVTDTSFPHRYSVTQVSKDGNAGSSPPK